MIFSKIFFRSFFVAALFIQFTIPLSTVSAGIIGSQEPPEWLKSWAPPQVPDDYRSPAEPHKIMLRSGDTAQFSALGKIRALKIFHYQGRSLYLLSNEELGKLPLEQLLQLNIRDDQNLIRLRDRFFDTTVSQPDVSQHLKLAHRQGHQLHLIQFAGPVQDDWLTSLRQTAGIQIVSYIPENAYLIWADQSARDELTDDTGFQPHMQWQGPFHPSYKLHPAFDLEYDGHVQATIQLFTHDAIDESINLIRGKASKVLKEPRQVGVYINILVEIPASELESTARLEDVVNIEPFTPDMPFGELQGQILSGSLNLAGTGPAGPGYLAWLNGLGFTTNFGFAIDITDDGFDRGQITAANVHPDLLDGAGNSRVVYVRRVNGTTISTTNDNNTEGHGTINAAIAGGLNTTPAGAANFAYFGDANGYRYGLGIAPFALIGSTDRFAGAAPDYTTIIDAAYSSNARISNNSWGRTFATGSYDAVSQEYDGLVRDARPTGASAAPSGGVSGNQEMVIVFAAGNSGPGATTLGDRGTTAKNTITVGASENFNATGVNDGCIASGCCGDNDANDIRQVIGFSSRGPTVDGRVKPDIMAPGTHIFGAASQDPGFVGSSVCGSATNDFVAPPADAYYPPDPVTTDIQNQTLYTWSSGTSHAAPAVAGGAALLRQWFLNKGHTPPSPAMTKASLINSSTFMTGPADNLPSNNQGMGQMNLGMVFDNTPRLLFDQVKTAHTNGVADADELFTVTGQVADSTLPFRVTMAFTDFPGNPTTGVIRNNDLDLEVQVGGNFYRGNDFTLGVSDVGAVANPPDTLNTVESVFLPVGTTGNFTVTVRPTRINSDGVSNNGDLTDQDFALEIYNAEFPGRNPVDIILVLDVSGSMNSIAAGGTTPKIDLLKDAVELFIRTWEPFSIPEDRMGIVYFSSSIASTFPTTPTILLPFQANANAFITNVRSQTAGGCTALGAGILTADGGFDTLADRQRHIMVFTNGMQNRSPMVTTVGTAHQILADPGASCGDSGVADNPAVNLADYTAKKIHTIGTGASGAVWTTLITDIANQTGGLPHFTATPDENLEDFFLDDLVAALRVDPVEKVTTLAGTLTNADSGKFETFEINESVRKATFVVSWRGDRRPSAVNFSLIAPDGTTVPPGLIDLSSGPFYRIASLNFPLSVHGSPVGQAGTWQLVFHPDLATNQVDYRAHLIVDDADVRYHFDVPTAGTGVGEPIPLSLWVQQGNRTLTGLQDVKATVTRPPTGFGSFMVKHPVSKDKLQQPIDLSGDQFANLAGKKGFILLQDDALRKSLTPISETIQLFDDGLSEHGDAKANDGVYNALYTKTQRPGFYDVDLSFRHDNGAGVALRTDSKTVSVGIEQVDLSKSTIDIRRVQDPEGDTAYRVTVMLIDKYKNYIGPGYNHVVIVALPGDKWGGRRVQLKDNLDGSYSGIVRLTEEEVKTGARLVIDVGGKKITTIEQPPAFDRRSASIHFGSTIPTGTFNNSYDSSYSLALDLDYQFTPQLSVVGLLGYNHFKSGSSSVSDTYWWNLSANLKYTFTPNVWRPYVNGGLGFYAPESGSSEPGFNLGAGVDYSLRPNLTLEIGADYHNIFTSGNDIEFLVPHIGVIYHY